MIDRPAPSGAAAVRRRVLRLLIGVPVLLPFVIFLGTVPAAAHASLESTSPAQGSEVSLAPSAVTLVFGEDVGINATSLVVTDLHGHRVDDGDPRHAAGRDSTVTVALPGTLPVGSYDVTWRVVSADGHPVSGIFAFGVGVPAGTVQPTATVDPLVSRVQVAVQLFCYLGSALIVGGSLFLFWWWPEGHDDPRMRRLMIGAVVVGAVGALGSLVIEGPYLSGARIGAVTDLHALGRTATLSYGRPLLLRLLAVALAVPVLGLWPRLPRDDDADSGRVAAVGDVVLLAASFSLTGHASVASPRPLAEIADGVHLICAGLWLGGLTVLLLAYLPWARRRTAGGAVPDEVAGVLRRWSVTAATAVALLVATGVYQGWRETGAPDVITGTTYGRLLLGKVGLLAVMLASAAFARSIVRRSAVRPADGRVPRAADGRAVRPADGSAALRVLARPVAVEAGLGLGVLVLTSFLVSSPPAATSYHPPFSAAVTGENAEGDRIRVVVSVDATRVGLQTVHLRAYTPTGTPLRFVSASGELRLRGTGAPVRTTFAVADGAGTAGGVVVPSAGRWTLTVQILTDATTDYAASATYTVR